jgi:CDP-diacylglycerol---serine O-phosphatidyltransferase
MLRFLDPANALTLVSLVAALSSAALAINGQTGFALVALIGSGICDIFDGMVARRLTRSENAQRFGGTLDSLVDACAFGFAPSVLFYCAGMRSLPELIVWTLFPICVVWRVTYFEVICMQSSVPAGEEDAPMEAERPSPRFYTGLPATYAALLLPLAAMLGFMGELWFRWGVGLTAGTLCLLMISSIPVPKPRPLAYIVYVLMAIVACTLFITYNTYLPNAL